MSFVIYGTRLFGRIEKCAGTSKATKFFHISFVPLVPIKSFLLSKDSNGRDQAVAIPLSSRSVLAAYARVWSLVAAIALIVFSADDSPGGSGSHGHALALMGLVGVALLVGFSIFAFVRLGALDAEEAGHRRLYARFAGVAADVRDLPDPAGLRQHVKGVVDARVRASDPGGAPAKSPRGDDEWVRLACDPTRNDDEMVAAALTLARLDQMRDAHAAIWQRAKSLGLADQAARG